MGKPYFRERDGLWVAQIELAPKPDGTRRRKYVTGKRRADVVAKQRAALQEIARMGDATTNAPTVEQWLATWHRDVASRRVRPKTAANYAHMVALITPVLGKVRIDKLSAPHVRRLHAELLDVRELSVSTVRNAHAVLRAALADAATEGLVLRNIAEIVKPPPPSRTVVNYLDADQAQALLLSVADDERAAIRWSLALIMAMRQGEALGLRADHVDLDTGTIDVEWQLQELAEPPRKGEKFVGMGDGFYLTEPKSARGERLLPMPDALWEMMRRYIPRLESDALVCGPGPVASHVDYRAWQRALKAADLPAVRLHSARHSALTLLAKLDVPDATRQRIAGHASVKVTNTIYTHAELDDARSALGKLSDLVSPRPALDAGAPPSSDIRPSLPRDQ